MAVKVSQPYITRERKHFSKIHESHSGACPETRKDRCAREARPKNVINIHYIHKIRHYYHGALDLFFARTNGKRPKPP